jgi:hypothetical protein
LEAAPVQAAIKVGVKRQSKHRNGRGAALTNGGVFSDVPTCQSLLNV